MSSTWIGTAVQSGDVRVVIRVGGSDMVLASRISVNPRSWSWDTSKRSFAAGQPGDLDSCITGQAGLTADVYGCSSSNPGVLINPGPNAGFGVGRGSGPNQGLWYVTNPITRMDLRTQIASKYRPDGATFPVGGISQVTQACANAYAPNLTPNQNNHGINTVCFHVADFSTLVSSAWNHEGLHLNAAEQEAQQAAVGAYRTF